MEEINYKNIEKDEIKQPIKKAKTAYILFMMDKRDEMKNQMENEGLSTTAPEVMKYIGEQYHLLNEEDKQKYVNLAIEDKKRYLEEKEKENIKNAWIHV